jgi:hypothetical protein
MRTGSPGMAEPIHYLHGQAPVGKQSSLYRTWNNMRGRCNNPRHPDYANYGGRGIKICERWNNFANFADDMGLKPSPKLSIDRINNDGDYEPSNCRWATQKQQINNQRPRKKRTEVL